MLFLKIMSELYSSMEHFIHHCYFYDVKLINCVSVLGINGDNSIVIPVKFINNHHIIGILLVKFISGHLLAA